MEWLSIAAAIFVQKVGKETALSLCNLMKEKSLEIWTNTSSLLQKQKPYEDKTNAKHLHSKTVPSTKFSRPTTAKEKINKQQKTSVKAKT